VSGKPDETNTGYTGELSAYAGPSTITQDGAEYTDVLIGFEVNIDADNVIFSNFKVDHTGSFGFDVIGSHSGIVIEDGEVIGVNTAIRGKGFTASRLNVHDVQGDCFKPNGTGPDVVIETSYCHDIGTSPTAHADSVQLTSTTDNLVTVRYNNFDVVAGGGYKANAVYINSSGLSLNVLFHDNWLNGGGWTIYCKTGVNIQNNLFGRSAVFGLRTGTCTSWTGNTWEDTGEPAP
jgi:hypothetical protein